MQKTICTYITEQSFKYCVPFFKSLSINYPAYPHVVIIYNGNNPEHLEYLKQIPRSSIITEFNFDNIHIEMFSPKHFTNSDVLFLDIHSIILKPLDHIFLKKISIISNHDFIETSSIFTQESIFDEQLNNLLLQDNITFPLYNDELVNKNYMFIPKQYRNEQTYSELLQLSKTYEPYIQNGVNSILSLWMKKNNIEPQYDYKYNFQSIFFQFNDIKYMPLDYIIIFNYDNAILPDDDEIQNWWRTKDSYKKIQQIYNMFAYDNNDKHLYIFGWPSYLGGADTKLHHLLDLLHNDYKITVIPNYHQQLSQKEWTTFMDNHGITYGTKESILYVPNSPALSLCNQYFIEKNIDKFCKTKNLKVIWSSEMMWHFKDELTHIEQKLIDKVLYVSDIQKSKMNYPDTLPSHMTGNYINPEYFPYKKRNNEIFTIGRMSRPDPDKYPENFPVYYSQLNIPHVKYRIMGWSDKLTEKYKWFTFDNKWDLLEPNKETQLDFLYSLDVFLYPLGHKFIESWGRSTVEAMLTGCIPIVQSGHHLDNLIIHGQTGFIIDDYIDLQNIMNKLYYDKTYKDMISLQCHEHAKNVLCNREEHIAIWKEALSV